MTSNVQRFLLLGLYFITGFCLMVFELLGARILAPFAGNSLAVWTSVIGVVLLSLSLGYYVGGRIAEKSKIGRLFFLVFLSFLYLFLIKNSVLVSLQTSIELSHSWYALISSIILFAPTSFLLALIAPVLTKKIIEREHDIGIGIGNVYAISALGSISGTFLTGFFLIPQFGVNTILISLGILMFVCSLFFLKNRALAIALVSVGILIAFLFHGDTGDEVIHRVETSYGLLVVKDINEEGRAIRRLYIDNLVHSQIFLDHDDVLAAPYAYYYDLPAILPPDGTDMLMIGGGAYAYPIYFLNRFEDKNIEVVEINPKVTEIAQEYFGLEEDPRLLIHHDDGRVFLQKSERQYDAILIDAFNGFTIPAHLASREFAELAHDRLNENGMVVINIPGILMGKGSEFLRAEYKTYQEVFPYVDVFLVREPDAYTFQNMVLVAQKTDRLPYLSGTRYESILNTRWTDDITIDDIPILTDDFSPVDHLTRALDRHF